MQHINAPQLTITANGTTSVRAAYGSALQNVDVIEVSNTDTSNVCFVKSGNSTVTAGTSDAIVMPGQTAVFLKSQADTHIAIAMASASTVKNYVVAGTSRLKT